MYTDWDAILTLEAEARDYALLELSDNWGSDKDFHAMDNTPKHTEQDETSELEAMVKIEPPSRLEQSIQLHFLTLERVTKEEDLKAGALLLTMVVKETGEVKDVWVPKKLCSNLCLTSNTVYIWEVFAQSKFKEYL